MFVGGKREVQRARRPLTLRTATTVWVDVAASLSYARGRGLNMAMRLAQYRFWILLGGLAIGVLVACSSSDTSGGGGDGATENAADSMTHS
jgi:hypothetical protein